MLGLHRLLECVSMHIMKMNAHVSFSDDSSRLPGFLIPGFAMGSVDLNSGT